MRNPAAIVLTALTAASAAVAAPKAPVAATETGPVRGVLQNGIDRWLGIPYAAPPAGDLRWRPPQAAARWTGVRDATQFANHCPQIGGPFGLASTTEDCLYLNVYTPARGTDAMPEDEVLPVMFWIHGGALRVGESDGYDPTRLVQQGVVVVTINYRLGVLGFLAHPALTAESPDHVSGNYGILDQQAALAWVQRNIAHFGGDPARVTIFGESAGGLSVHTHVASPLSHGLFSGAIVESGAYSLSQLPLASDEAQGKTTAATAGCADQTAACLRGTSVESLLEAYETTHRQTTIPTVDGKVLTQSVGAAFTSGQFNQVPVMEGSNHDEWRLFVPLQFDFVSGPVTPAGYVPAIAATLGVPLSTATSLSFLYPLGAYASPDIALSALGTDVIFACNSRKSARLISQFVPTYAYEFNDPNAPQRFLPPASMPYAAAHASEIQYIFDLPPTALVPNPPALDANQQQLAAAMVAYWTNFAKTGSPNWLGSPVWPAYTRAADQIQSLAPPTPSTITGFAAAHKCAVWAPTP